MTFTLANIIGIFTLIQLIFLSIVTYNYKKGRRISNRLLTGYLASNALLIGNWLMWPLFGEIRRSWTVVNSIGSSFYLLLMPFLYLYLRSLCYGDFRLKYGHVLHFAPFVITALLRYYAFTAGASIPSMKATERLGSHIIQDIQIFSYLLASVVMLFGYRKRLKEFYSSIEKIDLAWCNLLLVAFAAMWCTDLLHWLLGEIGWTSRGLQDYLLTQSLSINFLFTLALSYKGLVQSESISGIRELPKYATSRLKPSEYDSIIEKLDACMQTERPFLSSTLTVEDLALKLNLPVKHISQAIHGRLNQNFYDFINSYRIEESKRCIRDESYSNQTLLAVAYDVGFNSKSVFNASFKKHTGMTPKEYRVRFQADARLAAVDEHRAHGTP